MKSLKIILPLFPLLLLSSAFNNGRAVRDLIEWNDNQKVVWEDYKGRIADTSKIASSTCGIYCIPQIIGDSGEVTLTAYFDRTKSWVSKKHSDSLLLQHEQGHFDLTEVYTRKLRKKIASLKLSDRNFTAEIQKFYNWAWEDLQKQQEAYDKATDHGAIEFAQSTWENYINKHLELYKEYDAQNVMVKLRE